MKCGLVEIVPNHIHESCSNWHPANDMHILHTIFIFNWATCSRWFSALCAYYFAFRCWSNERGLHTFLLRISTAHMCSNKYLKTDPPTFLIRYYIQNVCNNIFCMTHIQHMTYSCLENK